MSEPTEEKKKFSPGKLIRTAGTIVALGLLGWLLVQQDWREIGRNVAQIGLTRFLLAVGLLFLSRAAISFRWYALLRGAGQQVTYFSSLRLTFAGLFGNNFIKDVVHYETVVLWHFIQHAAYI